MYQQTHRLKIFSSSYLNNSNRLNKILSKLHPSLLNKNFKTYFYYFSIKSHLAILLYIPFPLTV